MAIEYRRIRTIQAREIIAALIRDGFYLRNQEGRQRYQHDDGRRVTVSFPKSSDTFPPKRLKRIIEEQARWGENDLVRLKIL